MELPVHKKSNLLQKTTEEQVKSLADCKNGFQHLCNVDDTWFQVDGRTCAMIQAQVQQLGDKAAAVMEVDKKRKNFYLNFEKAKASFYLYVSGGKMTLEA